MSSRTLIAFCSTGWIFNSYLQVINWDEYNCVIIVPISLDVQPILVNAIRYHSQKPLLLYTLCELQGLLDQSPLRGTTYDLITDNEFREYEQYYLRRYGSLCKRVLILDHGCKNSQDDRFINSVASKRMLKNLHLLFFIGPFRYFELKRKRIYLHSKRPWLPLSKYQLTGYLPLQYDLKHLPSAENSLSHNKTRCLILTNGANRYQYESFRARTLSCYQSALEYVQINFEDCLIDIKPKPREYLDLSSVPFNSYPFLGSITLLESDLQLSDCLSNTYYHMIITSIDSITFSTLHILGYNVVAYCSTPPRKLGATSWNNNLYRRLNRSTNGPIIKPLYPGSPLKRFTIQPDELEQIIRQK